MRSSLFVGSLFIFTFFISNHVQAATETVKIYSNEADTSIQTSPYPGSWLTQYYSTIGIEGIIPFDHSLAFLGAYNTNQGYLGIHRSFLSFDTFSVPDDAEIIMVKLRVVPNAVLDEYDDQYSYMSVLEGRQASATALTVDDIEMCGNELENPVKGSPDIDITNITVNQPLTFLFNETGKGWINKDGYTKLCIREGHDVENKEIVNNGNFWRESGIVYYTSEKAGIDMDPYLEVTYEVPDPVVEKTIYDLLHELIGAVEGYDFSHEVDQSYMANLGKLEGFFNAAKYLPSENQLRAFITKLGQDLKSEKITQAQYDDLLARANALLALLSELDFGKVPLMTQISSPYPSLEETTAWAEATFAGERASTTGNCGLTIAQCGCAITSLSMLGKNYGIDTGFDGTAVNPLNMNNWLLHGGEQKGYDSRGNMMWSWGLAYLGKEKDGKYASHLRIENASTNVTSTIESFVEDKGPALAFNKPLGHWTVLTGNIEGGGFSVRDPYWYNTKTTDDDTAPHVKDYNDVVTKAVLFAYRPALKPIQELLEYSLNSPAQLLLTDEKGRRVGYDAQTGMYVNEIPSASYDPEYAILNQANPSTNPHYTKHLMAVEPEGDVFELQVIGTGAGEYHLTSSVSDGKGSLNGDTVTGMTDVGEVDSYTVVTNMESNALPAYLKEVLALIPANEQKKFIQAFKVIFAQTEKDHVAVTKTLIENLIRYTENQFGSKVWAQGVVDALKAILP